VAKKSPEQAATVALRRTRGRLQVCLIRRKDSKSWGIPKGLVDPGDTHEETALNEAWEEAGLTGRLVGNAIGTYKYQKWGRSLTVAVFVMEVLEQEGTWLEDHLRERKWMSFTEAESRLVRHPVSPLLPRAKSLFSGARDS
jgi:phosphohistidine phosphatase